LARFLPNFLLIWVSLLGPEAASLKRAPAFDSNEFKSNQLVSWGDGSKTVSYTDAKPSDTYESALAKPSPRRFGLRLP
jgi:hypothetical protein